MPGNGGARAGAGRKAKPLAIAQLTGSRTIKEKSQQPTVSAMEARPLEFMTDREKYWFGEYTHMLHTIGLNSETHQAVISLAAIRTSEVENLSSIIEAEGYSYQTEDKLGNIIHRTRPETQQRNEALRHLHSLLSEMGLSPSAINRIKAHTPVESDPFADLLKE